MKKFSFSLESTSLSEYFRIFFFIFYRHTKWDEACRWCKLLVEKLTYELLIEGTNVYNSNNFSKSGFSTFLLILIFQPRKIFIVGDFVLAAIRRRIEQILVKRKTSLGDDEVMTGKMHYKLAFNFLATAIDHQKYVLDKLTAITTPRISNDISRLKIKEIK